MGGTAPPVGIRRRGLQEFPHVTGARGKGGRDSRGDLVIKCTVFITVAGPLPSKASNVAVRVGQGGGQRSTFLRLTRRQGYRSFVIRVGDGDGHRDSGRCTGRIGGGNRHGISGLGFIVQGGLGSQLAGGGDDCEGGGIGSAQGITQFVIVILVRVSSRYWVADYSSLSVLGNATGSSIFSGEHRGVVVFWRLLHYADRYRHGGFVRIVPVSVGRHYPQEFAHVTGAQGQGV